MKLYDDEAVRGRRGVLPLSKAVDIVQKKVEDKKRFMKFTEKYAGKDAAQEFQRVPGASYQSFKDLI